MARLIETVFGEGVISTLYGPPGSGKTNLAVVFIERATELGYHVYTIINFFKEDQIKEAIKKKKLRPLPDGAKYKVIPPNLHIITSVGELFKGLLTTENNIVVLDETGFFGSSKSAMSKKVRTLEEIAFIIRHLNASLFLIAQSKGSLVPNLREKITEFELRVKRISKERRKFTIAVAMPTQNEYGEEITDFVEVDEYYDVPPTHLPFDSKFLPKFTLDIDLTEALDRLGPYNSVEVMKVGKKIIEELIEEGGKKNITKKEKGELKEAVFTEFAMNPDAKLKDIAKKFKTSYGYVRQLHMQYLEKNPI